MAEPPAPLALEEAARRAGRAAWVAESLFALVGRWASEAPEAHVRAFLAPRARHHAWHAELWQDLLPVLPGRDPRDVVVAPPGMGAVVALAQITPLDEDGGSMAALAGLHRVVLPRHVVWLQGWRTQLHPVTDGATARAIDLVLRDLIDALLAGEALVQGLVSTKGDVAQVAELQLLWEAALVSARARA